MSDEITLDGGPLVERLRRLYTMGGGNEKRQFPGFIPPIQIEAAERITALEDALRWRKTREELPEAGADVSCRMRWRGRKTTCVFTGYYARKFEIEASCDDESDHDYDEIIETYFLPEGWYENQYNGGDYSSIGVTGGEVIEWRPIQPSYAVPDAGEAP